MADDTKRVFHPTLPTYRDVPSGDVESWAEAGWRKSKPKDVEVDDTAPQLTTADLPK